MENYEDASKRHHEDAELLMHQAPPRLANASHLFGLSAECSLKAIAQNFEPNARFSGRKGHIPDLFFELQNIAPLVGNDANLVNKITSLKSQFAGWEVGQRYAPQTTFNHTTVANEQKGSKSAYLLMTNCLHGLI
jgi:hypothetical protein